VIETAEVDLIYDRQKELPLNIPPSVSVIGVGGVGSWVALDFALVGVKNIVLVDPDKIEASNLNRTPFKLSQVGKHKVQALMELVLERRDDVNIMPLPKAVEKLSREEKNIVKDTIVIDCRDTLEPVAGLPETPVTGGYDGLNITMMFSPKSEEIWGDEPVRYRTVPSYVVPPQFIASLVVNYILNNINLKDNITFNINEIYNLLLTLSKR